MPSRPVGHTAPPSLSRPQLGCNDAPGDRDAIRHARGWLAHLEAGRIGNNPSCPPEVAARREANEAVVRRFFDRSRP